MQKSKQHISHTESGASRFPRYEKHINWTPYQYAMNNPVSFVYFDGFSAEELNWLFQTQKSASNTIAELNQNNTSRIEYEALLYTRNGEFKSTGALTSHLEGRIFLDREVSNTGIINGQVVRMHSHPNDKPFSDDDIVTAGGATYDYLKYSVVVAKEHVYASEILDRKKAQEVSSQTISDIYSQARSKALKSGATYSEAELTGCKAIQKKYPGIFQFYYSKNAATLIFKEVK